MARPKGSTNKPKIDGVVPPKASGAPKRATRAAPAEDGIGHNSGELTDEQRQKLHLQHKGKYEKTLKAKKAADADFRNACKLAKSELGDFAVLQIKLAIAMDSPEGELKIKARLEAEAQVLRWNGLPIGHQDELFGEDRTPSVEKAFNAGKAAGMAGEHCKPPHDASTPQGQNWISGWNAGQAVNLGGIKQKADDEESDVRPAFLRGAGRADVEAKNEGDANALQGSDPLSDAMH